DEWRIDIVLAESRIGAIVAIEDKRKGFVALDRQKDERGQALAIGRDSIQCHAFAGHLLLDEPAHLLIAYPGNEPGFEPEPRRADGNIGGTAADRFGKARDILEARADLLTVEIDGRAADGD